MSPTIYVGVVQLRHPVRVRVEAFLLQRGARAYEPSHRPEGVAAGLRGPAMARWSMPGNPLWVGTRRPRLAQHPGVLVLVGLSRPTLVVV